jgi:hypothetical protein
MSVQITIYYRRDDEWLIELLKTQAYAERKSVSQLVLTALEWYFSQVEPQAKGEAEKAKGEETKAKIPVKGKKRPRQRGQA